MEFGRGALVQRGGAVQHSGPGLLPRAEAALPTLAGPPLPPACTLRLLPPVSRGRDHPRQPRRFASAVYQVSSTVIFDRKFMYVYICMYVPLPCEIIKKLKPS